MKQGTISKDAPRISLEELRPADILLSRGHGLVSDMIVAADGGSYSHGALWSGTGIIQATSAGITLSKGASGQHAVFRHKQLDDEGAKEVVAIAERQLDGNYAYGELVMLGLLFSTGLRVKGALLDRLLDTIGGPTAAKLKAWLDDHAGKKTRVCTELVASCYYKTRKSRFALRIWPVGKRPRAASPAGAAPVLPPLGSEDGGVRSAAARATPEALATASASARELLIRRDVLKSEGVRAVGNELATLLVEDNGEQRKLLAEVIARVATSEEPLGSKDDAPVGVVTPADLEFSPSLEFKGYFTAPAASAAP